ncbi:MAG: DUF2586 family protein [Spirochaetaceae bacterium]|nr:DUF2586 family protein [Spirochaetaceae bacterium]
MANRLPSVNSEILDGGLGIVGRQAVGAWAAVGAASKVPGTHDVNGQSVSAVQALGTPAAVRTQLGRGDLPELTSSALAVAEGQCHAVSVAGTGAAATLTAGADNSGDGTIAIAGKGTAEYSGTVAITKDGLCGVAQYRITIDGVMDEVRTTPASDETYVIPDTGLTLTFTDAAAPSGYDAGDTWTLAAAAPTASAQQVLAAVEELACSEHLFEWISVAGVSTAALWAALGSRADALAAAMSSRYFHFKCQLRGPTSAETVSAWLTAVTGTERGQVASKRVQVWAPYIKETDPWGVTEDRAVIGRASGMSAALLPHQRISAVKRGPIPGATAMVPVLTDAQILQLDRAGYATVRVFPGRRGIYVTRTRMLAGPSSDFSTEDRRRVMDRACRQVDETQIARYLGSEIDLNPEGLDMFRRVSEAPLQLMQDLGEITAFRVEIASSVQETLSTDTIRTRIRIQPLGAADFIENEIAYSILQTATATEEQA